MRPLRVEYKWLVGAIFALGLFVNLLDITIVNVALPTFASEFNASTAEIQWVVNAYLLSLAVFIPISGWAGDKFGTKRAFMIALAVFTLGSFLCALSQSIEQLIAFRVVQGAGGGMLAPVGTAMLFRAFAPSERAQAGALLAIPTAVAPAMGPVLGGYLVQYQSWHWIFLINVPIGILGLAFAWAVLREEKQQHPGRLDVWGFVLSGAGLAMLVYALAEAGSRGLDDPQVLGLGAIGLLLLAVFTIVELRVAEPMIDVRLFRNRLFRAANIVGLVGFGAFTGLLFLLPLLLQSEMGLSPMQSGLTTFPQAFGVALMAQPAGRLYQRFGPRRMLMIGMIGGVLTALAFVAVDLDTSQWWIRAIMFGRGCFFAFLIVPLQTATFATIGSEDTGRASSISNAVRQVGSSFGVAILATVLANRFAHYGTSLGDQATKQQALLAFHDAFLISAILLGVAFFITFLIDDKEAAPTMRQPAETRAARG